MRTRSGTAELTAGGDGTSREDRLYSERGRGSGGAVSWDGTDAQAEAGGAAPSGRNDGSGGVQKTPWFDPVTETEVTDCPGGVCPVPWATIPGRPNLQPDMVNHPPHYTDGGIEAIEAIEAQLTSEEYRGYLKGCIAKYIWRERHKGGTESLKKAQWYLERLIDLDEN